MVFDWNNPIGLGLFFLMVAASAALLALTLWLVSRAAPPRTNRRG